MVDDDDEPVPPAEAARNRARQPTFPGMCSECGACHGVGRTMPVRYQCLGQAFTEHECLRCRLNFDRQGAAMRATMRIEGRHGRGGASPVPCSLMHLARRAAHAD